MDSIRVYNNKVIITFDTWGKNFTLKVPHYKKWLSIIKLLRSRGFEITENQSYKEHYTCLSKFHKIGIKKDVRCLMEIGANRIEVQFGHVKNLWTGIAQSFWDDKNDDRYTHLSYLEACAVNLEVHKLIKFCDKYKLHFVVDDASLSPEEYILNKEAINKHIHGSPKSLLELKQSITEDSYDYKHNSNDRNKKKIICGEKKYFYNYWTKRLSCGIVWHNINNMWWVIYGGKLNNVASFELFDYEQNMPRRLPANKEKIESVIKKFEKQKDYMRCYSIQKQLDKLFTAA